MNVRVHQNLDDTVTVTLSLVELTFLNDVLGPRSDAGSSVRASRCAEHPGRQFVEVIGEFYDKLQRSETIRELRGSTFAR